jgi:AbrB family looped-hinge helix DNA binding protein
MKTTSFYDIKIDTNYNLPYFDNMAYRKKIPETKEVMLRIDPWGRIYIPATLRIAFGLQPGSEVIVRIVRDRMVLSKRDPIEELRAMFKNAKFSTKDFIEERKEEAKKDSRHFYTPQS